MSNIYTKDSLKNVSHNPFSFISSSTGSAGLFILALLMLQVIMLFVTKSYNSLLLVLVSVVASCGAEAIYFVFRKKFVSSFVYAVCDGIILGLLLPADYPLLAVLVAGFCCILICKFAYDGFGHSWINSVALTVIVLYFLNMSYFDSFLLSYADLQTKNPALILIQNGTVPLIKTDSVITAFLNKTVFNLFGIVIPEGYISLFWDSGSSIAAFRFNFITLISSIILISFDMIDFLIPAFFIFTYSLLVRFVFPFFIADFGVQGDILLALLTSGTLFSSLYLLQYYGTVPVTRCGKCIYGILAGIIAFCVIGCGTSSCGFAFVIVGMNIVSALIQYFEDMIVSKKINNVLFSKVQALSEVDNV